MTSDWFTTSDGVKLKYQITGTGPAFVLANGLGGSFPAWHYIIDYFSDHFTFYTWDYRGLFESTGPEDPDSITVHSQSRDLDELMAFWGIEKAVFAGWSYGGQVLVDYYSKRPEKFKALILLNAMVGSAGDSQSIPTVLLPLYKRILGLWSMGWHMLKPLAGKAVSSGVFLNFIKGTGLISSSLDDLLFEEMALNFVNLDHKAFQATLESAQNFNGMDVLDTITIPALVIAGSRDFIVMPSSSRTIASRIPNCNLKIIKNTSHYSAVEKPAEVITSMENFISRL